jgi:hypothetical protein
MASEPSSARVLERVERAYELGRMRRALLAMLPIAIVIGIYLVLGRRPLFAFVLGGLLVLLGTTWLWRGLDPGKAVGPGFVAGVIPVLLLNCLFLFGHSCPAGGCTTHCLPTCIVGGLAAGLGLAYLLRRVPGKRVWWYGGGLIVLTGLLGCPHATSSHLGGLVVGVLAAGLLSRLRPKSDGSVTD